ncbi:ABC transporter ATP-binding protein [Haloplanus aerogenes]|uniref:ATP-binding cassette subfamily B protein n=1 Tax=Haloplanus aerogenes TaxID=660522 RepID=A0A3M0CYS3_9EURY|nr:ABC transporter ATP-binding protein [Haloplanus aerogenes]RMB12789.1 ATP-binding cassette subfamily B protein [Haloplanus aerogenes]
MRDDTPESGDYDAPLRRVLLTYGRSHLPAFLLGGVASACSIALELLPSYLLGLAIDVFFTDARPFALPLVPDAWLPTAVRAQFGLLVGVAFACYLGAAGLAWINSWAWNHFAQHLQHAVRTAAYRTMQDLELAFFEGTQTGELMSVLNNDVNQLEEFLTTSLHNAMRIVTRVVVIGAIMLWLNWQLALVSLAVVPILVAVSVVFVRRIQPKYGAVREQVGSLNARLENNLGGIETVKAYTNEAFENDRVASASGSYLDRQWDAIRVRIAFFPVVRAITATGYTVTFLLGGWWVLFGPPFVFTEPLSAGVLVTFLLYSRRFRYPMRRVGEVLDDYQYASAAAARIVDVEERRPRLPEVDDAVDLVDPEGRVTYEHVSFAYPGSDGRVLEDVSFAVAPGDFVGVVGPTGAGKTTLLKLLLRFYEVDAGAVRIDGHDVRDLTRTSLRDAIGYVSQEPYLFHGTVAENIRYGREDADRAAVVEAAKRAGAHEFVTDLPDGYDTVVGERGVKLSGGQRQRLAIARALVTDPELFVLDEATSHVDNETETVIRRQLAELTADRTTFAIAHRLSTVRDADTILVFDDGQLVEHGTHEELLAQDGLYADLWAVQVGSVEDLPARFASPEAMD